MERKYTERLRKDLAYMPVGALVGAIEGGLSSFIDPLYLMKKIKGLREGEIFESLTAIVGNAFSLGAYSLGIFNTIERLVQKPEDPTSYIPIALNVASGIAQVAYHLGKR